MTEETSYSDFMADEPVAVSHDYTSFEKLADGAYCTLWRACKDGQWVVVKALQPQYRDSAQYEMLLRKEYDILSMFDSPYVVKVYACCDIAGYGTCIVMEWIDGVTLKEWLQGPASPSFPVFHVVQRVDVWLCSLLRPWTMSIPNRPCTAT